MRLQSILTLLLSAGLAACAIPESNVTGEQRIQMDTATGLVRFSQEEEDLNRAYACGLATYPEVARIERKVRGYAEANTPRTSPAELHAQASKIAREFGKPSPAGCINAKAKWAGLQRIHATTEPTQSTMVIPIPPSTATVAMTAQAAAPAESATPGRFREFELDTLLVVQSVACRLVDAATATMLVGRMADYWHLRSPGTARDALMQRASDIVFGMPAMARSGCPSTQIQLLQLIGRYRARLVGERRPLPRAPAQQAEPHFRFKEPESPPGVAVPNSGKKVSPDEVSDL